MPSLKDILGGVVKDAGKAIDNAVSGNQRQNNQQQNKGSVTFADILNQYRQQAKPQQQSRPQQQWHPVQQAQQYNAPQISEQQKKNEPAQKKQESKKEEDKENRKRFNDAAANALKGMLFGGAANAANLLLSPGEANAEEANQSDAELKPNVETENSQKADAKEDNSKSKGPRHMSDVLEEGQNKTVESDIRFPTTSLKAAPISNESGMIPYESALALSPSIEDFSAKNLGNVVIPDSMLEGIVSLSNAGGYSPSESAVAANDIDNIVSNWTAPQDNPENLLTEKEVDRIRKQMSDDTLKEKESPWDNENWFTDAYGYMNTGPVPITWDTITGGKGYKEILDNQDLVYNEDYDKILKPEKELSKDRQEERQANLEDEMRAMSNAQAYLLENPGAAMGGHKIGDQTINELMSEVGNNGEGYLKNEERPELGSYTADDLESMSDIVLYDLALRDPDFQKYMTDTYGAGYGNVNAFFDQYLNADNGEDKEAITRDIFLGNDAFELDPVLQAQLMQRVYNGNADLANMDPDKQGDEIVKAIMEQYGFDNPLDVALWGSDEGYQNENPLTYDREAALVGAMFSNMMDGYGGKLSDIGLSPEDIALYAAIGNSDIRGNAFDDRYNGLLSQYDRDEFLDLIGLSGYKDEFKKLNFNNDNTDGKGEYTYRDWKDPGRNWSMASLYDAAAQAQTPEELQQALGVLQSDASYNPVFIDAADRLFDRGWQHGYKYGARTPQAEG